MELCVVLNFLTLALSIRYIHAEHSRDQLRITRSMLAQILTYYQVMPAYLDFMFVFGAQSDLRDLRFSGFREQTMIKHPARGPTMPRRSGRQFQLCYNLKGVTLNKSTVEPVKPSEWSIRQAAILHQFDVVHGTTLWIVTKGRLDVYERFKELTGRDGRIEDKSFADMYECFRSSLAAHLMYCHWSTEDWRWYIRWLENQFEMQVRPVKPIATALFADVPLEFHGYLWSTRPGVRAPAVQAISYTGSAILQGQDERGGNGIRVQR